ncbi:hypothetical protein ACFP3I_22725 [Chryseobacterium arachidis]
MSNSFFKGENAFSLKVRNLEIKSHFVMLKASQHGLNSYGMDKQCG